MKTIHQVAIAEPIPAELIEKEIATLNQQGPIAVQAGFDVYLAQAAAIPNILQEIGRLREITFRSVGEGTGRSRDLDRFDDYYGHLFLWDRKKKQIAGGYRLGRTDLILAEFGFQGLYLSTLCEVDEGLLDYLNPALELGRSWVGPDYQRSLHALLGLWKGIGGFVARYPRYSRLFGAVSTSDDYTSLSQKLIVRYFRRTKTDQNWRGNVRPLLPFADDESGLGDQFSSVEEVSAEVSRHEPDGKGLPVLLRQYFKMNATLLDFALNPYFQHCLEALILVDLTQAPGKLLKKYMGPEGYANFTKETSVSSSHRPENDPA